MLRVEDVYKSFKKGGFRRTGVRAVDGVGFTLERGRTLGIVGESGSGKSTLAMLLPGLLPTDSGEILLEGEDITRMKDPELNLARRKIQVIFQHPFSSFNPSHRLGKSLAEPFEVMGHAMGEGREALGELLDAVDLGPDILARFPHQVSGGELQRLAVARALALEPSYLVLDEATAMLDVSTQARILHMLKAVQARLKIGFILISHDPDVAAFMSDDIAVMHRGRFVETGRPERIINAPAHPHTRQLIQYFKEFYA